MHIPLLHIVYLALGFVGCLLIFVTAHYTNQLYYIESHFLYLLQVQRRLEYMYRRQLIFTNSISG